MAYINKAVVLCMLLLLSYWSSVCIYVDFGLTFTISLCRDWTAICKGAIILELRMFGLAPLLRSKRTLSIWFFFVAQCSGVFPEESITFNTRSKERKQNKTNPSNVLIALKKSVLNEGLDLCNSISLKKERKRFHEMQCIVLNWLNIMLNIQYLWEKWERWNLSVSCPLLYIISSHAKSYMISLSTWLFFFLFYLTLQLFLWRPYKINECEELK